MSGPRCNITTSWNHYLTRLQPCEKDLYFTEGYVRLYENTSDKGVCFVYERDDKFMLFPHLVREFTFEGRAYKDFETAYGYGGPLYNTTDKAFRAEALKQMFEYMKSEHYVAGLVRFHPLLRNYEDFNLGHLIKDRKTVAIDLDMTEEEIWLHEIHTKNRNVIRRGEKNGLKFYADYKFEHLSEFIDLYNKTMNKLSAERFYYFDLAYYQHLKQNIRNSFLGEVTQEGEIISAAIFMYDREKGHYHLSGSNPGKLNLLPNNYMIYQAALELKQKGVKLFHLGGGTTSDDDDPLLGFKSRFSKSSYDFYIATILFDKEVYDDIVDRWSKNNPAKADRYKNYILKYKY